MMKRPIRLLHILFILLAACLLVPVPVRAQGDIERIKLKAEQLPRGWKLMNEFSAPDQKIQPFRARFQAAIDRMLHQGIKVNGQSEVRLNYVSCPSEQDTASVYRKIIEIAGARNIIVRNGNVAVEILSSENHLKERALEGLDLPVLQKKKLRSTILPGHWRLAKEFFVFGENLREFERRYEVRIEEMINQVFLIRNQKAQVNYIAVFDESAARRVEEKTASLVGGINPVLRKGKIVVEVIAPGVDLQTEIAERLKGLP